MMSLLHCPLPSSSSRLLFLKNTHKSKLRCCSTRAIASSMNGIESLTSSVGSPPSASISGWNLGQKHILLLNVTACAKILSLDSQLQWVVAMPTSRANTPEIELMWEGDGAKALVNNVEARLGPKAHIFYLSFSVDSGQSCHPPRLTILGCNFGILAILLCDPNPSGFQESCRVNGKAAGCHDRRASRYHGCCQVVRNGNQ